MKPIFILSLFLTTTLIYGSELSLMSYNVQNLFDTTHDEGKDDYAYLPLRVKNASPEIKSHCRGLGKKTYVNECLNMDWNDSTYLLKLVRVAEVVKKFKNCGADIVVFQEVENIHVLSDLITKTKLAQCGYKSVVLIEGPDERGIDVGMISKLTVMEKQNHLFHVNGMKPTRGILQVDFKIEGKTVSVFGNHWPSQGAPTFYRLEAARTLNRVAQMSKSDLVVAVGDFNTLDEERPNPIYDIALDVFVDLRSLTKSKDFLEGTHWWGGAWAHLDKILVAKSSLNSGIAELKTGLKVLNYNFLLGDKKWIDFQTNTSTVYHDVPMRFDTRNMRGYSDHLPVAVDFEI